MFEKLSDRFTSIVKSVSGRGRLSEDNIKGAIRDIRMALLEADVALPVVKAFIDSVREKSVGMAISNSLSPGQSFIKIVNAELIGMMGQANAPLNFNMQPPAIIMLAGLQGAGKTTTAAKLANLLQTRHQKKVMLASCDIYRPAAIDQLRTLAGQVSAEFFENNQLKSPADIAVAAMQAAKTRFQDVLLVDTAGRLHIDENMMAEICQLANILNPIETLFVVDSMIGQDAVNAAKAFDHVLALTGVILTKIDGDARGGAALSIRHITGKPIKFIGVGEKIDKLEPFHPERMASRILGMGDVLSLIEEVEREIDIKQAQKITKKLKAGQGFNLEDLRGQLLSMEKMGGLGNFMGKIPGMGSVSQAVHQQVNEKQSRRLIAIINSMTADERRKPDMINGSRKRRIAAGSGTLIQDVNRLLKQHKQMSKMMKKITSGGMGKILSKFKGRLPPGFGS